MEVVDYNIILVDSVPLQTLYYPDAADSVEYVAEKVSDMIIYLINEGARPKDFTLVGFSLGAHVMGIAAYKTKMYNRNFTVNFLYGNK